MAYNGVSGAKAAVEGVINAEGTHKLLGLPEWVGYTFGSLFIVLGLLLFALYPKNKRRADLYKKEQLKEFNKQKKRNATSYRETGMFLPAWEKAKMWWSVILGLAFCIIGIAWLAGQTISSL